MRFVSSILRNAAYPVLHRSGWLARQVPTGGCVVVNYHGVVPNGYKNEHRFLDGNLVATSALRRQLRFLKDRYRVITPDDFRNWLRGTDKLEGRSVLITCDDGLLNNVTDMLQVLSEESVSCLFFVTGESCRERPGMLWYEELYRLLEKGNVSDAQADQILGAQSKKGPVSLQSRWWEYAMALSGVPRDARQRRLDALRQVCAAPPNDNDDGERRRWQRMSPGELRLIVDSGMTVGAHTMSHPVLAQCNDAEAKDEICESKQALERLLNREVWAFAYPFGNPATMGERELALAREAGFECAFVNVGGGAIDLAARFALPRTHVTSGMSLAEFEAHLSGFHVRLQAAFRT